MFQGSIVALITPMKENGRIDFDAVQSLVDFHLRSGTDGIVVAGTTGESPTIDKHEFKQLLTMVVEQADAKVSVLAGTGGANTAGTIAQTQLAGELGADGALVVTPYYNRPMQSGLLAHFHALADASPIPLVLYNVPTRTAVDLLPETVAELAQRDEIVAIKEAVADPERIRSLVALCGDSLTVLSGDDPSCLNAMRLGAKGVVSVVANVVPELFSNMCAKALCTDWDAAEEIDNSLRQLYGMLALESNPIPVKWVLYKMGMVRNGIRLPLLPLDRQYHQAIELGLQKLGLV